MCNLVKNNERWEDEHRPDHETTRTRNMKDQEDDIALEWTLFQKYKLGFNLNHLKILVILVRLNNLWEFSSQTFQALLNSSYRIF